MSQGIKHLLPAGSSSRSVFSFLDSRRNCLNRQILAVSKRFGFGIPTQAMADVCDAPSYAAHAVQGTAVDDIYLIIMRADRAELSSLRHPPSAPSPPPCQRPRARSSMHAPSRGDAGIMLSSATNPIYTYAEGTQRYVKVPIHQAPTRQAFF